MQIRNHKEVAYGLMRVAIGLNIFGHGFFRIMTGTAAFATGMAQSMEKSPLPHSIVLAFGYCIPAIELCLGTLLTVGFMTELALVGSALLMIALTFGTTSIQNWNGASTQLLYSVVFFGMLWLVDANRYSVDTLLKADGRE